MVHFGRALYRYDYCFSLLMLRLLRESRALISIGPTIGLYQTTDVTKRGWPTRGRGPRRTSSY